MHREAIDYQGLSLEFVNEIKQIVNVEPDSDIDERLKMGLRLLQLYNPYITLFFDLINAAPNADENSIFKTFHLRTEINRSVYRSLAYSVRFKANNDKIVDFATDQNSRLFVFGFLAYSIGWIQPQRGDILGVAKRDEEFASNWAAMVYSKFKACAILADNKMKTVNREMDNGLDAVFRIAYSSQTQPGLDSFGRAGFVTRGKNESYFRNIFYCGALLGKMHDIESVQLND